jgi:hypothetical protein
MGALALACFSKVYGTVFSGQSRGHSEALEQDMRKGETTSLWMLGPMMVLAGLCVWIGLAPEVVTRFVFLSSACLTHLDLSTIDLTSLFVSLSAVIGVTFLLLALILALIVVRRFLLGPKPMPVRETWNCGFSKISSRFQYTSSSFARSIVDFAKNALLVQRQGGRVKGAFPGKARMMSSVHDAAEEKVFVPFLATLNQLSRRIDNNRTRYTQMYLMYILLFLIFLLVWKFK